MSYLGPVSSNQDGTIINYIPYGTIENNTTRGWSACTLTWSGNAPSGAPTLTATQMAISASSVSPLSSLYSLLLTKSAANAQYQGFVSDAFTIKREDLAKVLTGSFYYEVASGTVDMSGSSTQSLEIWVYNVNANQWIQPAGYRGLNQSSGPGLVSFTFQTDSTAANNSYRIAVITQQTSTTAYTVKFDNFKVSPQTAPIGPVVTDWVSYTPTGGFTQNVTYTGRWRRVGDSMEVQFAMSFSGVTNSSSMTINLPTGYVVDSSKMTSVGILDVMASGQIFRMGAGYLLGGYLASSTSIAMSYISNGSSSQETTATNFLPVALALGDTVNGSFRVPISGWSSNVQLSNDTDTRVVAARAFSSVAQSISSVSTTVAFGGVSFDSHGGWISSTQYRIPVSGYYRITASMAFAGVTTSALNINVNVNGTFTLWGAAPNSALTFASAQANGKVYCNAGDIITVTAVQQSPAQNYLTGSAYTYLDIERLSGPSVIAATENVVAKYSTTAGQAITSTPATVVYATREIDSHGIVNTINGDITIPISGKYLIGVYGSTASATWASGQQFLWQIRKNGSFSSFINQIRAQTAYTGILESVGPTYIDCLAGDVINIQAQSSVATTLRTAAGTNFFYLVRLGN